jgi:hypothetical protein
MTELYHAYTLPPIPGAENYLMGGLTLDPVDPDLFYVIDYSESSYTNLRSVRAVRDACGHVIAWDGDSALVANIPYGDANIIEGPRDSFVFTEWPQNHISQLADGDTSTTWRTDMGPLGITSAAPHTGFGGGVAGLARIPVGYSTTGQLRTMTYGGDYYSLPFTEDPTTGRLNFGQTTYLLNLTGGPGGMAYVPDGSPGLTGRQLIVLEYNSSKVSAYQTDNQGTPIPSTRTEILSWGSGAWGGGLADPVSGDLYWAAWNGDNRIHVISGFSQPECDSDADCHDALSCKLDTGECVEPDPDADGDGIFDIDDNCPDTANADQADQDEDGLGDLCDDDADGDGDLNDSDCDDLDPSRFHGQFEICDDAIDNDCDGLIDLDDSDTDCDGDAVNNGVDNCPEDFNPGQEDLDLDTQGDACDDDDDGDGVHDLGDNCPRNANADQADFDNDGAGNICDADSDGDGVPDFDGDLCHFTTSDANAGVPERGLGKNRWADVDGNGTFDTSGKNPTGRAYTMADTAGCSCEQILTNCGYGNGHYKFGCSNSVMDSWTATGEYAGGLVGACKEEYPPHQ